MKYLPAARSAQWITWLLCYTFLLSGLLWLNRLLFWSHGFSLTIALRLLLLSFVLAGIVNGLGWLGGRLVWIFTTVAIVFGIIAMYLNSSRNTEGWGDLIGFLSFMLIVIPGFLTGLLAEGIRLIKLKRQGL